MVKRNPGMVIYKELNWETLMKTLKDSVKDITVITIILAFSGVFGYGVVFDDLTTTIASALVSITTNKTLLLFLVILFLLLCGMFMETTVIALILTSILLPVMQNVGVDPVVFGMIMMTCVTFGVMTPPVGTGLYTVYGGQHSGNRPLRLAVLRGGAAGGCLHGVLPGCRALAAEPGLRRIKKHQKRAGLSCVFKRGFARLL